MQIAIIYFIEIWIENEYLEMMGCEYVVREEYNRHICYMSISQYPNTYLHVYVMYTEIHDQIERDIYIYI